MMLDLDSFMTLSLRVSSGHTRGEAAEAEESISERSNCGSFAEPNAPRGSDEAAAPLQLR